MALVPYKGSMEKKQVDKKFTWVIKNFSSLGSEKIYSDKFDIRGCKWRLSVCPKGDWVDTHLSLYLEVADYGTLPSGWRRHARYGLTVVNQLSDKLSQKNNAQAWFDEKNPAWGFKSMIPLNDLHAKDSGFLVNGELKVSVELDLLEVIDKKFTWVIKNFSSLDSKQIYSDKFDIRGCKWRLSAFPKGYKVDNHLSLFLCVADYETLPTGWRRHARYVLTVVNQLSDKLSDQGEIEHWFDEKSITWGFPTMIPLKDLQAKDSGFLVNGELKVAVEMDLLEVIGKVEVNGFQILPSQVELVSRIFERYPEIATEFRLKNPNLRSGYMSLLLRLIDTLRQSPLEIPSNDLSEEYTALNNLTDVGFKLVWLEKKLAQVSGNMKKVKDAEIRMQEIEKQLKDLKQKWLGLEAQLEKAKAEVLAAKAPISFDDVI